MYTLARRQCKIFCDSLMFCNGSCSGTNVDRSSRWPMTRSKYIDRRPREERSVRAHEMQERRTRENGERKVSLLRQIYFLFLFKFERFSWNFVRMSIEVLFLRRKRRNDAWESVFRILCTIFMSLVTSLFRRMKLEAVSKFMDIYVYLCKVWRE